LAALCIAANAGAAVIEGEIIFPSRIEPAVMIYAIELDTARLVTAPNAPDPHHFSIDVPPGRYAVFVAPTDPGAPDVYGAYTEFSLCTARSAAADCLDHGLIAVALQSRRQHASVKIDDWYLSDDVAARLDGFRGVAGASGGVEAELLGAPKFSEYGVSRNDPAPVPSLNFGGSTLSPSARSSVQQALGTGPNFAGHVTATLTPCGPECGHLVLVDWRDGKVQEPPQLAAILSRLPCRSDEALLFRRDSRLLSATRQRGDALVTQYFIWKPEIGQLAPVAEYPRKPRRNCAPAPS
jgi:hypothetical protein